MHQIGIPTVVLMLVSTTNINLSNCQYSQHNAHTFEGVFTRTGFLGTSDCPRFSFSGKTRTTVNLHILPVGRVNTWTNPGSFIIIFLSSLEMLHIQQRRALKCSLILNNSAHLNQRKNGSEAAQLALMAKKRNWESCHQSILFKNGKKRKNVRLCTYNKYSLTCFFVTYICCQW